MWAIRRSENPIRICANQALIARLCGLNLELPNNSEGNSFINLSKEPSSIPNFSYPSPILSLRNFSTESHTKSIDKDSAGFSDLDKDSNLDEEESSESNSINGEDLSDLNSNSKLKKELRFKQNNSPLFKLIVVTHKDSVHRAIEKHFKDGNNKVEREEVYAALYNLRTRKLFVKALQLMEFLEEWENFEFTEREYMTFVDLTAKVKGVNKAEIYLEQLPKSMRTELTYRALLANRVALRSVQKAEKLFKKMQELGFELSQFTCNQLLLLYKRTDRKKVYDVLKMMEKENVKMTVFMYNTLIDIKGIAGDISGIEQLLDKMKLEGIKANVYTLSMVVKYYIKAGLREKAEEMLREMEGSESNKNRSAFRFVLPLYADLGKDADVARVWKLCEPDPFMEESLSAIYAWGKIKNVENSEKVFDETSEKWKKVSVKYYDKLLKVYADHKMLEKGKNLLKRMLNEGRLIGPTTLDKLIRLYVNCNEVKKGDLFLQKWMEQNRVKPMYNTYLSLLEGYANKGDYHNAENIFGIIRQTVFFNKGQIYNLLLRAYVNAKMPAYGFRERMKADNVVIGGNLIGQLAQIDGFRKSALSDLLD